MYSLPPNKSLRDKYYVGFYDGDVLICVLDLIDKYPNDNTVFIGFFMVNSVFSNRNIGSNIIGDLMDYIKKIYKLIYHR